LNSDQSIVLCLDLVNSHLTAFLLQFHGRLNLPVDLLVNIIELFINFIDLCFKATDLGQKLLLISELLNFFLEFLEGLLFDFFFHFVTKVEANFIEGARFKNGPKRLHFSILVSEVG
jgi:hypothetical protein